MDLLQKKTPRIWILDFEKERRNVDVHLTNLNNEEIDKANKFIFEKDRIASIVSRSALRKLLAFYSNSTPQQIQFRFSKFGKPELVDSKYDIHFNVSHSHKIGIVGFCLDVPIGVDIEFIKFTPDLDSVATKFFSAPEIENYLNLSEKDKVHGFFNCWTRKESFIKALGEGLSFPLDEFEVSLEPDKRAELLNTFFNPNEKEKWSLESIDTIDDYAIAFAIRQKIESFKVFQFEDIND